MGRSPPARDTPRISRFSGLDILESGCGISGSLPTMLCCVIGRDTPTCDMFSGELQSAGLRVFYVSVSGYRIGESASQ